MLKYFDLQPDHIVVDIGSGTGYLAERLFEKVQLKNRVWCVDPSAEMQEVAKKRKGVFPIQKTVEEFLDDLDKDLHIDRAMCVGTSHHFADPVKVFRGVESFLSPGGVFLVLQMGAEYTFVPWFKNAENRISPVLEELEETTYSCLRLSNFDVEVSEEKVEYNLTKSQWYDKLRGRYHSALTQLSDQEIEEGIDELERGKLKGLKLHDEICISYKMHVFKAKKKMHEA